MVEEQNNLPSEESSIDFGKIFQDLMKYKKLYYKVLAIAAVIAVVYTLSLPNYYNVTVKLSPELNSTRRGSSLSSLASSFGLNLNSAMANSTEALFPTLYPDLMNSVAFHTTLFNIPVHRDRDTEVMTYYDYLLNEQKSPWWSAAIGGVMKGIGSLLAGSDTLSKSKKDVNPFRLTKRQTAIAKAIDKLVVCDVDKKTLVITIQVTDQDPVVCATMADSVQERLQTFITEYRTSKARNDLEYSQKLYVEAKREYDKARQMYATFADANQDLILQSVRMRQVDLENEMQLKYNAYNAIASQLQSAKAKVQEETPAFTTLQSATVPIRPVGPRKVRIVLVFLFLAFLGTTTWVLYKDGLLKPLLGL